MLSRVCACLHVYPMLEDSVVKVLQKSSYKKCEQMILKTKEILGETDPAGLSTDELADTLRAWWRSSVLP